MNAKFILAQILGALPSNKDWLDPHLEAMAREAVKPVRDRQTIGEGSISAPTLAQLEKLPQWAQAAFRALMRERDESVANLKEWVNDQTPSPISIAEHPCTGDQRGPDFVTRYVHADNIKIEWMGCRLEIGLRKTGPSNAQEDCISLQWEPTDHSARALAFIPESYQRARIQHPSRLTR